MHVVEPSAGAAPVDSTVQHPQRSPHRGEGRRSHSSRRGCPRRYFGSVLTSGTKAASPLRRTRRSHRRRDRYGRAARCSPTWPPSRRPPASPRVEAKVGVAHLAGQAGEDAGQGLGRRPPGQDLADHVEAFQGPGHQGLLGRAAVGRRHRGGDVAPPTARCGRPAPRPRADHGRLDPALAPITQGDRPGRRPGRPRRSQAPQVTFVAAPGDPAGSRSPTGPRPPRPGSRRGRSADAPSW